MAADDRRAHAAQVRVLLRRVEDAGVGQPDSRDHAVLRIGQGRVVAVGPRRVHVLAVLVELADHVTRELAGHLTTGVAAHAVGDDEDLLVLDEREVVLVVGALHTHISFGGVAKSHNGFHPSRARPSWKGRRTERWRARADDAAWVGGGSDSFRGMAQAQILTIGDELLSGDTVNSNLAFLGERCRRLGVTVVRALSVRDRVEEIVAALRDAAGWADICLVSGGLGPTSDDRTAEAVAAACGVALVRNGGGLAVEAMFARFRRPMPEINRKQADSAGRGRRAVQPDRYGAGVRRSVAAVGRARPTLLGRLHARGAAGDEADDGRTGRAAARP
jgi:molybdenum cofactor synthesis domain-containing protein